MELKHCPRDIKLLMVKYNVNDQDELMQLIKYSIIEPDIKLHILYKYGVDEVYTLQNMEQGCRWLGEVVTKRKGYQQYYLERLVVSNNRLKKARYYIEDVKEILKPKIQVLF